MRRHRLLPEPDGPVIARHSPAASSRSKGPASRLRRSTIRRRGADVDTPFPYGRGAGGGGGGGGRAAVPSSLNSPPSELGEQPNMRADSMVEAALLELLVRAVHLVVVKPEANQQAVD